MNLLVLFLIVIGVAFVAPIITRRLGLPEVTGIILFGIILGGYGLFPLVGHPEFSIIRFDSEGSAVTEGGRILIELGNLGLIFLMFLAGLEMDIETVRKDLKETILLGLLTFIIPFALGYLLGWYFYNDVGISMLIAIILSTTSIGVVVPILKELGMVGTRTGGLIIGAATIDDVLSMVALAIVLKWILGVEGEIIQFISIVLLFFLSVMYLTPKFGDIFLNRPKVLVSIEAETRFLILILLIISVVSEEIGLHPMVGAFIAGLAFSETLKTGWFTEKLNAIGYGFFIPIFFFVVGAKTDLWALMRLEDALTFCISLIAIAIAGKFLGAFIGGMLIKLDRREMLGTSFAMITRLAVGLAAANVAYENNMIDTAVFSSFVLLAAVTTILTPPLAKKFLYSEESMEAVMFSGKGGK